jgi:hypothetical protein
MMMSGTSMNRDEPHNKRTALVLGAVALAFFLAIVLKYWMAE